MNETITSAVIITICVPIFTFWMVTAFRLLAEGPTAGGNQSKPPYQPPFLMTVFA